MNNKTNIEEDIKILKEKLKQWEPYKNIEFPTEIEKEISIENKALENILADREEWKRLAGQNLKNSEEFKNNMCEHRCIKNNEILELQAKANKYDALVEKMKEKLKELKENDSEIYDTDSEDLVIAKYETRAMIDTLQELIPEEE